MNLPTQPNVRAMHIYSSQGLPEGLGEPARHVAGRPPLSIAEIVQQFFKLRDDQRHVRRFRFRRTHKAKKE